MLSSIINSSLQPARSQTLPVPKIECVIPFKCLEKSLIGYGPPPVCESCAAAILLAEYAASSGAVGSAPIEVPIFIDMIQRCPTLGEFDVKAVPRECDLVNTLKRALREYAGLTHDFTCSKALQLATKSNLKVRRLWGIIPKKGESLPTVLIPCLMGTLIIQEKHLIDRAVIDMHHTYDSQLPKGGVKGPAYLWFPYDGAARGFNSRPISHDGSLMSEVLTRSYGIYLHIKSFSEPQSCINISDDLCGLNNAKLIALARRESGRWERSALGNEMHRFNFQVGNCRRRRLTVGNTWDEVHNRISLITEPIGLPFTSPGNRLMCDYWYIAGYVDLWDSVNDSECTERFISGSDMLEELADTCFEYPPLLHKVQEEWMFKRVSASSESSLVSRMSGVIIGDDGFATPDISSDAPEPMDSSSALEGPLPRARLKSSSEGQSG